MGIDVHPSRVFHHAQVSRTSHLLPVQNIRNQTEPFSLVNHTFQIIMIHTGWLLKARC